MEAIRKIRIGNDIKIKFTLDKITEEIFTNIKQIHCYLVNTSPDVKHPINHIDLYCVPTEYTIRNYGLPVYNVVPDCSYNCGFSVHKHNTKKHNKKKNFCNNVEESIYKMYGLKNVYTAYNHQTDDVKGVACYYPACEQRCYGDYKLLVQITAQEHGWGQCGVHHYLIDYGTLFTLAKDGDDLEDGSITINVNIPSTPDKPDDPNDPTPPVQESQYAYFCKYDFVDPNFDLWLNEEVIENGEKLELPIVDKKINMTQPERLRGFVIATPVDSFYENEDSVECLDSDGDNPLIQGPDGITSTYRSLNGKYIVRICYSPNAFYVNTITLNVKKKRTEQSDNVKMSGIEFTYGQDASKDLSAYIRYADGTTSKKSYIPVSTITNAGIITAEDKKKIDSSLHAVIDNEILIIN